MLTLSPSEQKCRSRRPTEAELITLTDSLGMAELLREFVEFITKEKNLVLVVYHIVMQW